MRVETGYKDRDQYQIAVLYQPGKPWTRGRAAAAVQPQAADHCTGLSGAETIADRHGPGDDGDSRRRLRARQGLRRRCRRRWITAGHNCNLALQAESLVMAKEHLSTPTARSGTRSAPAARAARWPSSGSPTPTRASTRGLLPTCSFPDAWSTATQFLDYHCCSRTSRNPRSGGSGIAWLPTQMGDVLGGPDGVTNAKVSDNAQFHVAVPTDPCAGTTAQEPLQRTDQPGRRPLRRSRTRRSTSSGREPQALWSASENGSWATASCGRRSTTSASSTASTR